MGVWTNNYASWGHRWGQDEYQKSWAKNNLECANEMVPKLNQIACTNFCSAESLNIPTLPSDVLRLIALYVAENLPIGGHNSPAFISPYLYKFRLISHAYAEVGLGVIKTLLRDDKYRRYRVLHLPYKDFALSKTTQTLQSLDVPAFVDTIEIQPFSVPACDITELEEERNHEIECATYGGWSEDEPDPLGQLQEERWIFLRQSGQQDQFLETRLQLNVRVYEYWRRYTLIGLAKRLEIAKQQKRAKAFHWQFLPIILRTIDICNVSSLYLTADSSMFQDMTIVQVQSAFRGLSSLVSLKIEMSSLDFLLDGTMTVGKPLAAAEHFNAFLACATNLEELVLDYHELELAAFGYEIDHPKQWPPAAEDEYWLASVLRQQQWSKLRTFEVRHFPVGCAMLLNVIKAHAQTLVNVKLTDLLSEDADKDELELEEYLNSLNLKVCKFAFEW